MGNKLDLANAQFIGFSRGKHNSHGIVGMVKEMGLSKKEWEKIKENYGTEHLDESDMNEIEQHFTKPANP